MAAIDCTALNPCLWNMNGCVVDEGYRTELRCTGKINILDHFDLTGMPDAVTKLDFSDALISEAIGAGAFECGGGACDNVTAISFQGVSTLRDIGDNAFSVFTSLETLNLVSVPIRKISASAFAGTKLKYLNMPHPRYEGHLDYFSDPSLNLPIRFLSTWGYPQAEWTSTNAVHVPSSAFLGVPNLQNLVMRKQNLQSVATTAFQGVDMSFIDFKDNPSFVPVFPIDWGANLKRLYLSATTIPEVPQGAFASMPSLQVLVMAFTGMHTIHPGAFDGSNVNELNLEGNQLGQVPQNIGAKHLLNVKLKSNGITRLPKGVFADYSGIYALDLSDNALEFVHPAAYDDLPLVTWVKSNQVYSPTFCNTSNVFETSSMNSHFITSGKCNSYGGSATFDQCGEVALKAKYELRSIQSSTKPVGCFFALPEYVMYFNGDPSASSGCNYYSNRCVCKNPSPEIRKFCGAPAGKDLPAVPNGVDFPPCPPGHYNDAALVHYCVPCPAGTVPSQDATSCKTCLKGSFSTKGSVACQTCPSGTYQTAFGSAFCLDCPQNSGGSKTGSTSIEDCLDVDGTIGTEAVSQQEQEVAQEGINVLSYAMFGSGIFLCCVVFATMVYKKGFKHGNDRRKYVNIKTDTFLTEGEKKSRKKRGASVSPSSQIKIVKTKGRSAR